MLLVILIRFSRIKELIFADFANFLCKFIFNEYDQRQKPT